MERYPLYAEITWRRGLDRRKGLRTAARNTVRALPSHMKIWIDMTAPAHVLVFRPIIPRLRERGHEVEVTARDYAQTLELLELHGIEHTAFGRHGGASRAAQAALAAVPLAGDAPLRRASGSSTSRSRTARTTSRSPPAACGSRP